MAECCYFSDFVSSAAFELSEFSVGMSAAGCGNGSTAGREFVIGIGKLGKEFNENASRLRILFTDSALFAVSLCQPSKAQWSLYVPPV
jgi:hypothetical protein